MTDRLLVIGAVVGAHGIRGHLKVKPFTGRPRDIAAYGPVTAGGLQLTLEVLSVTAKGLVIASAREITSREAAEGLRGRQIEVPRAVLPEAGVDEIYHADLVGLDVRDETGARIGTVVAMHDFGAGEIVEIDVVEAGGPSVMLPFTSEVVRDIDQAGGRMVVCPPEGWFDEVSAEPRRRETDAGQTDAGKDAHRGRDNG